MAVQSAERCASNGDGFLPPQESRGSGVDLIEVGGAEEYIEVRKRADLVVLGHDPTQANPDFITDIAVESTYVDGQCLYSRY